jgi:isoaspartyl peptidase/L-asparaginase-like protein (Ntn-hydrolase superfamily)
MKIVLAKTANDIVASGRDAQAAADAAIALLTARTGGRGGLIILDSAGQPGFAFSTRDMAYAYRTTSPVTSGIF